LYAVKGYGSIFYKVKRSDGFCAVGFCFIKNEHPWGLGSGRLPNKTTAKLLAAAGSALD
jgi:hypothetical protein